MDSSKQSFRYLTFAGFSGLMISIVSSPPGSIAISFQLSLSKDPFKDPLAALLIQCSATLSTREVVPRSTISHSLSFPALIHALWKSTDGEIVIVLSL